MEPDTAIETSLLKRCLDRPVIQLVGGGLAQKRGGRLCFVVTRLTAAGVRRRGMVACSLGNQWI